MNRLASESSPYLRQHAENPVDWFPWGVEAFATATAEDKPVLLSVGYSACHWCHVMAHESFEDEDVAKTMNDSFVNIKVDREERPDIDAIYMEATQAMTGQGGWPMTVFLMPNGQPFFAGTYFGKQSMPGHPSFVELIDAVGNAWKEQRDDITTQATNLTASIDARTRAHATDTHDPITNGQDWIKTAHGELSTAHDKDWGGFGTAPKFPQTASLDLLMRAKDPALLPIVTNSLDAMASGGIYDHVGGGFHRYSVDSFWMVPHFEKMLYDQAALARTYVDAYLVTGEEKYKQVATETINYVLRDLAAPDGGWYSAEDADSEGEEGLFYIWRPEALAEAIGDEEINTAFRDWYGVTNAGNFEGSNILHRPKRGDLVRPDAVEQGRQRVFKARAKRIRPGLDDKIVTEWNAMFLATLSYAASAFGQGEWLRDALESAEFLTKNLRTDDGRWLRVWHKDGGAKQEAFANDYAWLTEAFTRLSEATGSARWRALAKDTADEMIRLFWDEKDGGLFTTGSDTTALIVRPKDLFDGATASSNSTAAVALTRLGKLTGRSDLRDRALTLISLVTDASVNHPTAFAYLFAAIDELSGEGTEVVIAGGHTDLIEAYHRSYHPRSVLSWGEPDVSPLWEGRTDGAYVCRNFVCNLPTSDTAELLSQLKNS